MKWDVVVYGALSQPGVEMGTGSAPRPPAASSWSPVSTTCCATASSTTTGATGLAIACCQVRPISSNGHRIPSR